MAWALDNKDAVGALIAAFEEAKRYFTVSILHGTVVADNDAIWNTVINLGDA